MSDSRAVGYLAAQPSVLILNASISILALIPVKQDLWMHAWHFHISRGKFQGLARIVDSWNG